MPNVIYINPYVYAGGGGAPAPNPPQNVTITSSAQDTGIGATGTAGTPNAITAVLLYIDAGGNPATNVQTVAHGGVINFSGIDGSVGGPAIALIKMAFFANVTTSGGGTPVNYAWQLAINAPQNSNVNNMLHDGYGQGQGIFSGNLGGKADFSQTFGEGEHFLAMSYEAGGMEPGELLLDGMGETPMNGETIGLTFTCVATTSGGDAGSATPVIVGLTF
jgi:hypothetical protein